MSLTPITVLVEADKERFNTTWAAVAEVLKRVATSAQVTTWRLQDFLNAEEARARRTVMHTAYRAKTRRRRPR